MDTTSIDNTSVLLMKFFTDMFYCFCGDLTCNRGDSLIRICFTFELCACL